MLSKSKYEQNFVKEIDALRRAQDDNFFLLLSNQAYK